MSLINDLRDSNNHIDAIIEYEPLFLSVVKRKGFFLISNDTLDLEKMSCKRKCGKEFNDWLAENNLKIVQSEIKNHYKIFY